MGKSITDKEIWLFAAPLFMLGFAWFAFSGRAVLKQHQAEQIRLDSKALLVPRAILHQKGLIHGLVFSPDGKMLASGEILENAAVVGNTNDLSVPTSQSPPDVYLWDTNTGNLLTTLPGTFGRRLGLTEPLAFSADAKSLVIYNTMSQLWDISTASPLKKVSPELVALAQIEDKLPDSNLEVVQLQTLLAKILDGVSGGRPSFTDIQDRALSSQKRFFAMAYLGEEISDGYRSRTIGLWDVTSGKRLWDIPVHYVDGLAFSPDEKTLFAQTDFLQWRKEWGPRPTAQPYTQHGEITAFDVATAKIKWKKVVEDGVAKAVISPDGRLVACSTKHKHKTFLLNAKTGKLLYTLEVPKFSIGYAERSYIKFSPDGKTLATHDDQNIYLWDINAANLR